MLKKILLGLLGLVALVAVGVFLLGSNLDSLVKAAIEKYGTESTKAKTTVASVRVSPQNGEGVLEGFVLGNPEGFSTPSAIKVGKITVKIEPKSILGNGPVMIDEILIDAPDVTYEVSKDGSSNLQKIQDNAASYAASLTGGKKAAAPAPAEKPKESRKIVIKSLIIKDGQVKLSHELLKGDNLVTAKLPTLKLANIGEDKNGAAPEAVVRAILSRLTSAAISVGHANLIKQLREQGLNSLKGAAEESEIGKGVTKALDNIFNK